MKKELKSCTGVLLRARPSYPFWQLLVRWLCPVRSALKRTPVQDFNYFSMIFYYIISTTYKKIGDLFCPVHISGLSHSVSRGFLMELSCYFTTLWHYSCLVLAQCLSLNLILKPIGVADKILQWPYLSNCELTSKEIKIKSMWWWSVCSSKTLF